MTSKTLRIATTQMTPDVPATDAAQYQLWGLRNTAKVSINYTAWVPLPPGATITAYRFRGRRVNGNGIVAVGLYRVDGDGAATIIGSAINHNATGYQTVSATGLSELLSTFSYVILANIDTTLATLSTDNELQWVEVDYTAPNVVTSI